MDCPKCGSKVENKASLFWLGFLGRAAFPKYVCGQCGRLYVKDFNQEIQNKIIVQRVICGVLFLALLILLVVLSAST